MRMNELRNAGSTIEALRHQLRFISFIIMKPYNVYKYLYYLMLYFSQVWFVRVNLLEDRRR